MSDNFQYKQYSCITADNSRRCTQMQSPGCIYTPKILAKWPLKLHKQLPEIRLSSKAIVLKQPIKKIRINSNNSISPEFHPATKPLTVEPVDSGNEIGRHLEN